MMTPGTYLRRRREAAGYSVDSLALQFETIPHWPARDRAAWLTAIEEDIAPVSPGTAVALRWFIRFDPRVLDALIAARAGFEVDPPRLCQSCACSEWDPCEQGCAWSVRSPQLCSRCAGEGAPIEEPELLGDVQLTASEVVLRA